MSVAKKKKWLANMCRTDVKDRMDLSHMWTADPSTFSSQENSLWSAIDAYLASLDSDGDSAASTDTLFSNVLTAMAAI